VTYAHGYRTKPKGRHVMSDAYSPADDPALLAGSPVRAQYRASRARENSPEGRRAIAEARRSRDLTPVGRPDPAQAYDNATYRWNHREFEAPGATFGSVLAEELQARQVVLNQPAPPSDRYAVNSRGFHVPSREVRS
jgi:hypothetical protein